MTHSLSAVLAMEAAARGEAWAKLRSALSLDGADDELAALVLDDPAAHLWRTVDGALDRSICPQCSAVLGSGARGCGPCDLADGVRFLGREPDRPSVPPGNEHAIRVALTVVRFPHRWPAAAVAGNRLYLPLFWAGYMPTKTERYALLAALKSGRIGELVGAATFTEMAERAART